MNQVNKLIRGIVDCRTKSPLQQQEGLSHSHGELCLFNTSAGCPEKKRSETREGGYGLPELRFQRVALDPKTVSCTPEVSMTSVKVHETVPGKVNATYSGV